MRNAFESMIVGWKYFWGAMGLSGAAMFGFLFAFETLRLILEIFDHIYDLVLARFGAL